MRKFYVEKFNASDDSYKVSSIYVTSGKNITRGEIILSIESSKADIEIEAQEEGFIYHNFNLGNTIYVGDLFFIISNEIIAKPEAYFSNDSQNRNSDFSITRKAEILLNKYSISPNSINKKIIKESDVLHYLSNLNENRVSLQKELLVNHGLNKVPLIIIGAGGGAKMCIDCLRHSDVYQIVGLLDDKVDIGNFVLDIPVVGRLDCVEELLQLNLSNFIIAFGILENRKKRYELFCSLKDKGANFPNIFHPRAIIEESVQLGEGNVILAGANVGSSVALGNLNYINNNSLVSHDCVLADNIHVAPAAVLASSIKIESHVLIGMNTTIYYGINIGENSTILNGLTVNRDVARNTILKKNDT